MSEEHLKTMKEVAEQLGRPPHRIIHLCETGVVDPTVNATGRGSVRRFNRDDIFRLLVALELQEAGVQVPLIKPMMRALDHFLGVYGLQTVNGKPRAFDLVGAIKAASSQTKPIRAYLQPPNLVALVVPGFKGSSKAGGRLWVYPDEGQLPAWKVSVAVNLRQIAGEL